MDFENNTPVENAQETPVQPEVTQDLSGASDQNYDVSSFQSFSPVGTAAKKNLLPLWIAIAVIAVAGIGVGIYFLITGMFGSSYEKAEKQFFLNAFSAMSETSDTLEKNSSSVSTMTLTPTDELAKLIFGQSADSSDEIKLNPTTIELETNTYNQKSEFILTYKNGEKKVISVDVLTEMGKIIAKIPELSDLYLVLETAQDVGETQTIDYSKYITTLSNTFNKLYDAYIKVLGDVPVTKGTTVSSGDVTQKCDKYALTFNEENLSKILREWLVIIRDDAKLKADLTELIGEYFKSGQGILALLTGSSTGESNTAEDIVNELYNSIAQSITDADEYIAEFESGENKPSDVFTMDVYVSGNKIIARTITVPFLSADEPIVIEYKDLESGKQYSQEFLVSFTGSVPSVSGIDTIVEKLSTETATKSEFSISNSGTKENNTYNGEVQFKYSNGSLSYQSVSAKYTGLEIINDKYMNGKIEFDASQYGANAVVDLKYENKVQSVGINLYIGGKSYFTLSSTFEEKTPKTLTSPETNETNSVIFGQNNSTENQNPLGQYDAFIKSISEKFSDIEAIQNFMLDENENFDLAAILFTSVASSVQNYINEIQNRLDINPGDDDDDDVIFDDDDDDDDDDDTDMTEYYKSLLAQADSHFDENGNFLYELYCHDNCIVANEANRDYFESYEKAYIEYYKAYISGDDTKTYEAAAVLVGLGEPPVEREYDFSFDDDDDDDDVTPDIIAGNPYSLSDFTITLDGEVHSGMLMMSDFTKWFPSIATDTTEVSNDGYGEDGCLNVSSSTQDAISAASEAKMNCYARNFECTRTDLVLAINGCTIGSSYDSVFSALGTPSFEYKDSDYWYLNYMDEEETYEIDFYIDFETKEVTTLIMYQY